MATAKKVSAATKIRAYQSKNPDAGAVQVAKACGTTPAYVYALRASDKKPNVKVPKKSFKWTHVTTTTSEEPLFGRKGEKISEPGEYWVDSTEEVAAKQNTNTDAMLAERGSRYGTFAGHARISQRIKDAIFSGMDQEKFEGLAADQVEALEMIAHKIARIVNGDPNYADSWVDIGGYAKLVSDRLETGKEV